MLHYRLELPGLLSNFCDGAMGFQWQPIKDNAKGRIWHWLLMVVLYRPFRAKKAHVLFAGVGLYLRLVVEVAVVAVFFY